MTATAADLGKLEAARQDWGEWFARESEFLGAVDTSLNRLQQTLTITNAGGSTLTGTAVQRDGTPWLVGVDPIAFSLEPLESAAVTVTVDPEFAPAGVSIDAIQVESDAHSAGLIDVTVTLQAPPPVCGDGRLDSGEFCDDGNSENGDGCSPDCTCESTPENNDGVDSQCEGDPGFGIVDEITGTTGFFDDDLETYSWPAQTGATLYEAARSSGPEFQSGCLTSVTAVPSWVDPTVPAPSGVLFYLVRAIAPNVGSWGTISAGVERIALCP